MTQLINNDWHFWPMLWENGNIDWSVLLRSATSMEELFLGAVFVQAALHRMKPDKWKTFSYDLP